jgi:hypothetical protein
VRLFIGALASFAVVGLSGCGWGEEEALPGVEQVCWHEVSAVPCGAGVEQGVEYRYYLWVHCGIEAAYLDGHYWRPVEKAVPPPDWSGNAERGVITLVGSDEAVFVGRGLEVHFELAPDDYRPPPCV